MTDLFSQPTLPAPLPRFDGADYVPKRDDLRLGKQLSKIYELMQDSHWRSLAEIEAAIGEPQASVSAQLRHLRKPRFGLHIVNRRHEGGGLYRYQLIPR